MADYRAVQCEGFMITFFTANLTNLAYRLRMSMRQQQGVHRYQSHSPGPRTVATKRPSLWNKGVVTNRQKNRDRPMPGYHFNSV